MSNIIVVPLTINHLTFRAPNISPSVFRPLCLVSVDQCNFEKQEKGNMGGKEILFQTRKATQHKFPQFLTVLIVSCWCLLWENTLYKPPHWNCSCSTSTNSMSGNLSPCPRHDDNMKKMYTSASWQCLWVSVGKLDVSSTTSTSTHLTSCLNQLQILPKNLLEIFEGKCGRKCETVFFSVHSMFPVLVEYPAQLIYC